MGVVKSGKGNNVNGHNWNGLEFVHKVCNYLDFSNFSVQIAHYLWCKVLMYMLGISYVVRRQRCSALAVRIMASYIKTWI